MGFFKSILNGLTEAAETVAKTVPVLLPVAAQSLAMFNNGQISTDAQMQLTIAAQRLVAVATQAGIPIPTDAVNVPTDTDELRDWVLKNKTFFDSASAAAADAFNHLTDLVLKNPVDTESGAQLAPIVSSDEDKATLAQIAQVYNSVDMPTLNNQPIIETLAAETPSVQTADGHVNRGLNRVGAGAVPSSFTSAPTAPCSGECRAQTMDCGEPTIAGTVIATATPSTFERIVKTTGTTSFVLASGVGFGQTIVPNPGNTAATAANIIATSWSNATVPVIADGLVPTRNIDAGIVCNVAGGKFLDFMGNDGSYAQAIGGVGILPAVRATPSYAEAADRTLGELGFANTTTLPNACWQIVPQTAFGTATSLAATGLDRNGQDTALTSIYNVTMRVRGRVVVDESVFKDWTSVGSNAGDVSSPYELQICCAAYDPATSNLINGAIRTKSYVRTAVLGRPTSYYVDFVMPYEHVCLFARLCVPTINPSATTRVNRRGIGQAPLVHIDTPIISLTFATRANQLYSPSTVMACPTLSQLNPALVQVADLPDIIACGAIDGEGISKWNYIKKMDHSWCSEGYTKTALAMHNSQTADGTQSKLDALRDWLATELDDQLLLTDSLLTLQGYFPFPEDREQVQHSAKFVCELSRYLSTITAAQWQSTEPVQAAANRVWIQGMNYRFGVFFNKSALVTALGFGGSTLSEAAALALPTNLFLYPAGQVRSILAQLEQKLHAVMTALSIPDSDIANTAVDLF